MKTKIKVCPKCGAESQFTYVTSTFINRRRSLISLQYYCSKCHQEWREVYAAQYLGYTDMENGQFYLPNGERAAE